MDKREQCIKALKSIKKTEPNLKRSCHVVVINECGETSGCFLKKMFPWIDQVIDKKRSCGQASSLNRILDELRKGKYSYWLHWEESWVAKKPFLKICYYAMKLGIDQIQLTEDDSWEEDRGRKIKTPSCRYITMCAESERCIWERRYRKCKRSPRNKKRKSFAQSYRCRDDPPNWPMWSLRPGMDNAKKILSVGYFNQNPKFWPVHFELEFAYNWAMQKDISKAGIRCAYRQRGHRSFSDGD